MPSTYTTQSGVTLSRDAFIAHYVAAFLAAKAAVDYDDCCARGDHGRLERGPIEDALYLAEAAWEQMEAVKP